VDISSVPKAVVALRWLDEVDISSVILKASIPNVRQTNNLLGLWE
jgi:hypothetical protein